MNLRLSFLLVMVLLIFGGTFLAIKFTGSDETPDTRPWLYSIDPNNIVHVSVSYQDDTVSYQRKAGSLDWLILGEPEIPVFLPKWSGTTLLLSGPKVNRVVADTIRDPTAFGLAPPVTRVTIIDRSGNTLEFHLGDPTPDTRFQYANLVGDSTLFTVPVSMAEVVNRLVTKPPYLQLYQLEHENLAFIEVKSGGQSNIYFKPPGTEQWFIQGETVVPVFSEKWGDTPAFISGPRVDQVVAESFDDPSMYGLAPPQTSVRLSVRTGEVTEFQLGGLTDDGKHRYTSLSGEPRLFAMPEQWAQRISDLAVEPPYPPEASE
jgi:hypothetical protein